MKFFQFLEKALSESNGEPSGMRVQVFYLVVILVAVIAVGFIYVVWNHPDIVILYLTTIVTLIAVALGFKKWQKSDEVKEETKPEGKTG